MDVFLADQQIDAGNGQHDGKQDHGRGGSVGRIAAGVAVEHIVDITHDGVHFRRVQVRAEEGNRVGVSLERTDEAGDDEIEQGRRNHGQGDLGENPPFGGDVYLGGMVLGLIHGSQRGCKDQNFKGHNHPHGIEAQHERLRPVGAANEIDGSNTEPAENQIGKTVRVGGLLE